MYLKKAHKHIDIKVELINNYTSLKVLAGKSGVNELYNTLVYIIIALYTWVRLNTDS